MSITVEELKHMAELARLRLSDDSLNAVHSDLNKVLEQFKTLQELDLAGIDITPHSVELNSIWSEDVLAQSMDRAAVLKGAPKTESGLFFVPTIIE